MEFQLPAINLVVIGAPSIVAITSIVLMLLDLLVDSERLRRWAPWLTIIGLALALVLAVRQWNGNGSTFIPKGGVPMVLADNYATALNVILLLTGVLTVLISVNFLARTGLDRPEYYLLLLFSLSGMMLMGMANDLILIFLALELLSIPLYVLSGFAWPRLESEESAMKYFVIGAFSSGILVFGIALIYGATGSTALPEVLAAVRLDNTLLLAGGALVLVGLGFKVGSVPFHMWTPDVYEGAPTVVTAFMSVGAKVAGFAALLRILMGALPQLGDVWVPATAVLATLTLIVGNVVAIAQPNIKRMLGYSSIAHAGYILIAVAASINSPDGMSAALFYMFAYLFTNLGAFGVVLAVERQQGEGVMINDYRGLARRYPWMSLAMAFFMLSLTGVPPAAGFVAKFYVFRAAVEAQLVWLAIIGVVTSVISGYYYLRVVFMMYMVDGDGEMVLKPALVTAVTVMALITLLLGILPGYWFDLARDAAIQGISALAAGG
jgi:NADH-quinone oxidoreductase subunit N